MPAAAVNAAVANAAVAPATGNDRCCTVILVFDWKAGHHDANDCTGSSSVWPDGDGAGHGGFCGRSATARESDCENRAAEFRTPEDAARALYEAMKGGDWKQIYAVLGPGSGKLIYTGDKVADGETRDSSWRLTRNRRSSIAAATRRQRCCLAATTIRSPSRWSRQRNGWSFDAHAGAEEIVNRRVGENELYAIQTCLAYVDAQREYATKDRDRNGLLEYASETGQRAGQAGWPVLADEGGRTTQSLRTADNPGRG